MGKVIIELADSMEVKIKAANLADAIEKLIEMKKKEANRHPSKLARFRGIARFKYDAGEEEWHRQ